MSVIGNKGSPVAKPKRLQPLLAARAQPGYQGWTLRVLGEIKTMPPLHWYSAGAVFAAGLVTRDRVQALWCAQGCSRRISFSFLLYKYHP